MHSTASEALAGHFDQKSVLPTTAFGYIETQKEGINLRWFLPPLGVDGVASFCSAISNVSCALSQLCGDFLGSRGNCFQVKFV